MRRDEEIQKVAVIVAYMLIIFCFVMVFVISIAMSVHREKIEGLSQRIETLEKQVKEIAR